MRPTSRSPRPLLWVFHPASSGLSDLAHAFGCRGVDRAVVPASMEEGAVLVVRLVSPEQGGTDLALAGVVEVHTGERCPGCRHDAKDRREHGHGLEQHVDDRVEKRLASRLLGDGDGCDCDDRHDDYCHRCDLLSRRGDGEDASDDCSDGECQQRERCQDSVRWMGGGRILHVCFSCLGIPRDARISYRLQGPTGTPLLTLTGFRDELVSGYARLFIHTMTPATLTMTFMAVNLQYCLAIGYDLL